MTAQRAPIETDERSGVLHPENLPRFSAEWITPAGRVSAVVAAYWTVSWNLSAGESIAQKIIDFPAVTLSVESGNVPAPLMISVARPGVWQRKVAGEGRVFAIRLRPAGLAVVSDLDVTQLGGEQPVTGDLDCRLHRLLQRIAEGRTLTEMVELADDALSDALTRHPLTHRQRLANDAFDLLTGAPVATISGQVAAALGCDVRTVQRALRETVGMGPAEVGRRLRVQDVVRRLSLPDARPAAIAADLGYVDQAHMIRDFRTAAGITPGQYLRDIAGAN
ncbi:helix-turn-helix domain-containing protein [Microbacterium yannicii]|uniref:helix-turn-helix domain-containing protein n=1 Tax=Microbacterium yannicii TaxID=671622 RepID=UPI00030D5F95|nr:helix-turn-helix domain-containing protein [Microbacterium yannicii]